MEQQGEAVYSFPCGLLRLIYEGEVLTGLERVEEVPADAVRTAFTDMVAGQLEQYFRGERRSFSVPFRLEGTEFQRQVWAALCEIPYGQTRSYQDIAIAIGNPKAVRAVGMANNRNPVSIIVPCHRVIGKDGSLTGYGGGLDMKKMLLDLECTGKLTANS